MTLRALLLLPAVAAAAYGADTKPAPLSGSTPFGPPAGGAVVQAPSETIEFAGVSTIGDKTDLIFFDKAAKKHRWVPLKQTVDGIEALNYDARLDQAVVKINGVQKTLPLRKGSAPTNAPAPVPSMPVGFNTPPPPATMPALATAPAPITAAPAVTNQPAAPGTTPTAPANATPGGPETVAKQEQEARMLVSDLLEIGMAQRKAYEEAQRKAAGGDTSQQPNAAQPPTGTQPAPVQSVPAPPAQSVPAQPNPGR